MNTTTFMPSDLLLPQDCDLSKWSVVASDQYINQEDYWQEVEEIVGRDPSTLRLTMPESCLDGPDIETDIMSVNASMSEYLRGNRFMTLGSTMIYLERTLDNGLVRKGILGQIDLETYDYSKTASSLVRGAEWADMGRIPPRVAARKLAPLEVSHVILLADDSQNLIFDCISKTSLEKKYEVDLLQQGGSVSGWLLGQEAQENIMKACDTLGSSEYFSKKYGCNVPPLQFLIGDGNHSLITAKESYERQKTLVSPNLWETLPARYVMVELVNLYDSAVVLSPIHRILYHVEPQEFLKEFSIFVEKNTVSNFGIQEFVCIFGENQGSVEVKNPSSPFAISTLQSFLDDWLKEHPKVHCEYTQSLEEAKKEGKRQNTISIILPEMNKKELFPTVIEQGLLPRKAFTLGEPQHKRYYLEARRIRQ